jgi:diacylglycerol kinase (ATP)
MLATPSPRTDQEPEPEIHRPDRPTMVLLNPRAAGGQAAALAQPVRSWLAAHAPGVALVESDSIERSRATLQCLPRSSRVVLIGGDGTLHHMLPVLLTHRLALGVVPLGSGNDTARALGVAELPWAKALDLALRGPTRRMDVGELVTPRQRVPFFSSLAAGFDAAVGRRAIDSPRWLSGTSRYVWATMGELGSLRTHRVRIALDGAPAHEGEVIFASVLNTRSYGSGMPAVPGARVADGKLDLLVAGRFGRIGTLAMLPRLLKGTHLSNTKVQTWKFQDLQIESDDELPLAADGEPLEPLRRFEVRGARRCRQRRHHQGAAQAVPGQRRGRSGVGVRVAVDGEAGHVDGRRAARSGRP